ncbi:hypothetical protein JCM8547_007214 [Rhodosporidiobolus lusitaniae]
MGCFPSTALTTTDKHGRTSGITLNQHQQMQQGHPMSYAPHVPYHPGPPFPYLPPAPPPLYFPPAVHPAQHLPPAPAPSPFPPPPVPPLAPPSRSGESSLFSSFYGSPSSVDPQTGQKKPSGASKMSKAVGMGVLTGVGEAVGTILVKGAT